MMGRYDGGDADIPVEQINTLRDTLRAEGENLRLRDLPRHTRALNAAYRSSYRPAEVMDAWRHTRARFKDHGLEGSGAEKPPQVE